MSESVKILICKKIKNVDCIYECTNYIVRKASLSNKKVSHGQHTRITHSFLYKKGNKR